MVVNAAEKYRRTILSYLGYLFQILFAQFFDLPPYCFKFQSPSGEVSKVPAAKGGGGVVTSMTVRLLFFLASLLSHHHAHHQLLCVSAHAAHTLRTATPINEGTLTDTKPRTGPTPAPRTNS